VTYLLTLTRTRTAGHHARTVYVVCRRVVLFRWNTSPPSSGSKSKPDTKISSLLSASASYLLGSVFEPEYDGGTFPRNVGFPQKCTALQLSKAIMHHSDKRNARGLITEKFRNLVCRIPRSLELNSVWCLCAVRVTSARPVSVSNSA
jgi:hypothetical protein